MPHVSGDIRLIIRSGRTVGAGRLVRSMRFPGMKIYEREPVRWLVEFLATGSREWLDPHNIGRKLTPLEVLAYAAC